MSAVPNQPPMNQPDPSGGNAADYGADAVEIGFNVSYLMDALANMQAEMVRLDFQDTSSSVLITIPEQPGFKYVVMPMRI